MAFSAKGTTHRSTATGRRGMIALGPSTRFSRGYARPDGGRQCR